MRNGRLEGVMRRAILDDFTTTEQLARSIKQLHRRCYENALLGFLWGVLVTMLAVIAVWLTRGGSDAIYRIIA